MTFTVDYNRDFRSVFAAQGALARLVVQRAGLEDANPARSPGEPGFVWSRDDCPKTDEERAELGSAVIGGYGHFWVLSVEFWVGVK